jgi:hypothetical protein
MQKLTTAIDALQKRIDDLKDPLVSGPAGLSALNAVPRMRSVDSRAENDREVFDPLMGFSFEFPRHSEPAEGIAAAYEATVKLIDRLLSKDDRLLGLWRRLGSALADYQNELDDCNVDVPEATLPLPRAVVWQAERLLCAPSESTPALNRLTRFDPTDVVHFLEQVLVCRLRTSSPITPLSMVASGIAELSRSIANDLRTIEGLAIVEDAYLGITLNQRQRTASRLVDATGEGNNENQMRYVEFKGKDLPLALFTKLYELRGDILENEGDELRSIADAHGMVEKVTPRWRDDNYLALNELLEPIRVYVDKASGVGRKLVDGLRPNRRRILATDLPE